MEKLKIFCIPYAGGSAVMYYKWKNYFPNDIELYPVELAGRGKRFGEPYYDTLLDAVEDVYKQIKNYLDETPYFLFGHSMGSLIAYELYYKLKEQNKQLPCHIFFSAIKPPHIRKNEAKKYTLPDEEFKEEIIKLGGTKEELFNNQALVKIFLPLLKADYRIVEMYQYQSREEKIECNLTMLGGKEDAKATAEDLMQWGSYTKKTSRFYEFEGGHFFIQNQIEEITRIIKETSI